MPKNLVFDNLIPTASHLWSSATLFQAVKAWPSTFRHLKQRCKSPNIPTQISLDILQWNGFIHCKCFPQNAMICSRLTFMISVSRTLNAKHRAFELRGGVFKVCKRTQPLPTSLLQKRPIEQKVNYHARRPQSNAPKHSQLPHWMTAK